MNGARREEVVAYLLGELEGAEREDFERRLAGDPALRAGVEDLRGVVGQLDAMPAEGWEAQTPPPLDISALEAEAGPAPGRSRRRRFALPHFAWAGVAIAAAAAVAVALVIGLGDGGEPAETFELSPLAGVDENASATVELAASGDREATFRVSDLSPSPADHHYELWLLGEGDPVPLGNFTVGGGGEVVTDVSLPADPAAFEAFDVSVERDGGDPSHSGDSVLRGPVGGQPS